MKKGIYAEVARDVNGIARVTTLDGQRLGHITGDTLAPTVDSVVANMAKQGYELMTRVNDTMPTQKLAFALQKEPTLADAVQELIANPEATIKGKAQDQEFDPDKGASQAAFLRSRF